MATLVRKNTFFALTEETTQGTIVNPVDGDFVLIDDDFAPTMTYEEIERNVINGNLDPLAALVGMQDGSLQVTVELKGSGTAHTVPEIDPLLRGAFDDPSDPLSGGDTTVDAGNSPTSIDVAGTPGFTVGDIISVDVTGGDVEYALITAVTGTVTQTLTVTPAFSTTPTAGDTVVGGITYKLKETDHDFFSAHLFLDCVGQDGLWIKMGGCRPNMVFSNVTTGQIPKLQFVLTPINWDTQSTGSNLDTLGLTPDIDCTTEPPLCLGATISLGDSRTVIHTQNLEMDLGKEVTKRMSMIPTGGVRSSRFSARKVTGKYDLDLEDDSEFVAWAAETVSTLVMKFGDTAGNQPVVIVPYAKRKQVEPVDSDGIWIQDISYDANRTKTVGPAYLAFF